MAETIRAFVAIELSLEIKRSLTELIDRLGRAGVPGVRWVDPDSTHLTLKFLGNVGLEQVQAIAEVLNACAGRASPFTLAIAEMGAFPNVRSPRVVWVGLTGDLESLASLQRDIVDGLAKLGFGREERPFSPHLTLARVRDRVGLQDRKKIGQVLAAAPSPVVASMKVASISLMKSTLTQEGAIHERLVRILLTPPSARGSRASG